MKRIHLNFCTGALVLLLGGCAQTAEFSKSLWGSSTRSLEQARVNALVRNYDQPVSRCYDEVIKAVRESKYHIFIDNKPKATIVLMGIKGSVNTTRVGIFLSELSDGQTKIYVSSLSSNAKRIVAGKIFPHLDEILGASSSQAVTVINEQ